MFGRTAVVGLVSILVASIAHAGGECCKKAAAADAWCGDCKVGFVAGEEMKSQKLHDAMKGTEVKEAPKCADCKGMAEKGGWCSKCNVGLVGGKSYKSKFAFVLARGMRVAVADVKCDACKKNLGGHGWCDACKAGVVGNEVFKDKAQYDEAVKAHEVLETAIKASAKCDGCAVAMVSDGKCEPCKASFKDGKPVAAAKP
ncbi:MAG: hypothetical protein ACKVS9_14625 [Phycisphaerae bacterium]